MHGTTMKKGKTNLPCALASRSGCSSRHKVKHSITTILGRKVVILQGCIRPLVPHENISFYSPYRTLQVPQPVFVWRQWR